MIHFDFRQAVILGAATLFLAACSTDHSPEGQHADIETIKHICSSCHGLYGQSISPRFPNLAGQQREYLEAQLKNFQTKSSRGEQDAHTFMFGMAAKLTDADITTLAAYYAGLPAAVAQPGDPADAKAGKAIYENGIDALNVPACQSCHGAQAEGAGAIPRLAAQHPDYVEKQLTAFAANVRANEMMHDNSKNLTPDEIRELAAYISGL
jgi:cytochrome c553